MQLDLVAILRQASPDCSNKTIKQRLGRRSTKEKPRFSFDQKGKFQTALTRLRRCCRRKKGRECRSEDLPGRGRRSPCATLFRQPPEPKTERTCAREALLRHAIGSALSFVLSPLLMFQSFFLFGGFFPSVFSFRNASRAWRCCLYGKTGKNPSDLVFGASLFLSL